MQQTTKPLTLSLIIPVFNEERHLRDCLDSIARQRRVPDEVIIVDNNSADSSTAIARSYDFVRIVAEPKQGIVHARNSGFNQAAGDIIGRIDADTILPDTWAETVLSFYARPGAERLALTGNALFRNVRPARPVSYFYNFMAFDFNRLLAGSPTLWGSNMAITRLQWQSVKDTVCLDPDIHEDLDLALHLRSNGYKIVYKRRFHVLAFMKRVRSDRHQLWAYLQMWPNTLKRHGKKTWVVCWIFGAAMMYVLVPFLTVNEYVARLFGHPAMDD